ncbi:MAG: hypothetical protein ABW252_19295 [Polyangiales bacterium]
MNAVKQTLALALGVLAACGGSDNGNNDGDIDAGHLLLDASLGSGDAAAFACTSYTAPKLPALCGGSHCEQSPAKLRADTPTTAVCGSDTEVTSFCTLDSVNAVGNCAVMAALGQVASTKECAKPMLQGVRDACLDCYVASSECAKEKCFLQCISRETPACDECRVREGCIEQFYTCSGHINPLPASLRP